MNMTLDEIKNSLNSNSNLTDDMKDCLMELISIFNAKFPNVDLTNLNERLKTLQIVIGSKFLIRKSSSYNPTANEMLVSLIKIDDNIDCRHILMRELLNIITAKDNFTGFNKDNAYEALNVGYTQWQCHKKTCQINRLWWNQACSSYNNRHPVWNDSLSDIRDCRQTQNEKK